MGISHSSILLCASSGVGKSYLATAIISKLKHQHKIIIDYSAEYDLPGYIIIDLTTANYIEHMSKFDRYIKKYKKIIVRFIDFDDDDISLIVDTISNWCFKIGNIFITMDECHNYIPHGTLSKKKGKWTVKIATMGRKFGISSMFITQRPSLLNPTIRSNTNIKLIGRLTDGVDVRAIADYIYNNKYITSLPNRYFIYRDPVGKEYLFTTEGYNLSHNG